MYTPLIITVEDTWLIQTKQAQFYVESVVHSFTKSHSKRRWPPFCGFVVIATCAVTVLDCLLTVSYTDYTASRKKVAGWLWMAKDVYEALFTEQSWSRPKPRFENLTSNYKIMNYSCNLCTQWYSWLKSARRLKQARHILSRWATMKMKIRKVKQLNISRIRASDLFRFRINF
jgi:hypothetical protein